MITIEYPTLNELEVATIEQCCEFFQNLPFPSNQYEITLYFQLLRRVNDIFEKAVEESYEFILKQNPDALYPEAITTKFTLCIKATEIAFKRLDILKNMLEATVKLSDSMKAQLNNLQAEKENLAKQPRTPLVEGTDNVFVFKKREKK